MKLPKPTSNFEPAPAGNHIAVCYGLVDMGTQPTNWGPKRTIRIMWELSDEPMNENGDVYTIGKDYNFSMSQKSNLRHDFIAWRGRDFTEDEFETFEMETIIGAPCMLNVTHQESAAGNMYAKVGSIAPLPKGAKKPDQQNPSIFFSFEEPSVSAFELLGEYWQEKISETPEFIEWREGATKAKTENYEGADDCPF